MKLTPMEDLMLENLVARVRLGESFWHFPNTSHYSRAANGLVDKGLVTREHGQVPSSFRLYLTEEGKREGMDPSYTPPFMKSLKDWYKCDLCGGTFYLGEHYCTGPKQR